MEGIEKAKQNRENLPNMTLRDYYRQIPESVHPKTDFVNEIAMEAGVSVATVRNWIVYGMKPKNAEHIGILVRKTGIPAEQLWA